MKYLLDTHTLIWLVEDHPSLSKNAKEIIATEKHNDVFISKVSFWEIAIKLSIKKLEISYSVSDLIKLVSESGIVIIGISDKALISLASLPFHHRDPFDRLLICEAMTQDMAIITDDSKFKNYEVETAW